MNCPRCETVVLDEKERDGILVDACPTCRGIWLDRGELEKLIQRSLADVEQAEASRVVGAPRRDAADPRFDDRDRRPVGDPAWIDDRRGYNRREDDRHDDDRRYDDRDRSSWDRDRRRDDDDDDDRHRYPKRRRGFLESLGDIFD